MRIMRCDVIWCDNHQLARSWKYNAYEQNVGSKHIFKSLNCLVESLYVTWHNVMGCGVMWGDDKSNWTHFDLRPSTRWPTTWACWPPASRATSRNLAKNSKTCPTRSTCWPFRQVRLFRTCFQKCANEVNFIFHLTCCILIWPTLSHSLCLLVPTLSLSLSLC